MTDNNIKLSIIILHYNTEDLLENCLKSLIKSGFPNNWEIIIVDNCSTKISFNKIKETLSKLKEKNSGINVKLIDNPKNLGFSAGNNVGIKESRGEYILLLNSDTLVEVDAISTMLDYLESNPLVGVATCRVELENGKLDLACHRGFPTPWASFCYFSGLEKLFPRLKIFGGYHLGYLQMEKVHEIDSPTGAFYLIRKKVVDKVGLLDESFFMYAEDLDWSYRIKKAGWKIIYFPEAKITHLKKRSGRKATDRKLKREMDQYFYETMKLFYRKHFQKKYPKILLWLIFLAIDIKKFLKLTPKIAVVNNGVKSIKILDK